MKMRTEKQIYDTILNFAKADDRIRVVTLEGSRTNINIIPDDFQDYDITFFVTDMQSFINSDEWLNVFGERLIMQKPEDMELFPKEEKGYSYLLLFWDGVKIDLTLLPLEVLDEYFTWDKLVKLLLDKDIILVEGYKNSNLRKIEVYRSGVSDKIITPKEKIIAVASDINLNLENIKVIDKNSIKELADLIEKENEFKFEIYQ